MKIRTEFNEAIGTLEQQRTKAKPDAVTAFGDMLAQEVQKSRAPTGLDQPAAPPPGARVYGAGPLLALQELSPTQPTSTAEQEVMEHIDSLLNKWENYAHALKTPSGEENLRQAYGVLENISSEVRELKGAVPGLGSGGSDLKSMVNEILTVTEQFKFNRGDYL